MVGFWRKLPSWLADGHPPAVSSRGTERESGAGEGAGGQALLVSLMRVGAVFIGHLSILFGEMPIQILCPCVIVLSFYCCIVRVLYVM